MKSSLFRTNVSAHWKYVEQNHKDAANTTFILQGINEVVQRLNTVVSDSFWPLELQPARLLCSPLSPGVCSNSCPLSQWCHPTNSHLKLKLLINYTPIKNKIFKKQRMELRNCKTWQWIYTPPAYNQDNFNFSTSEISEPIAISCDHRYHVLDIYSVPVSILSTCIY